METTKKEKKWTLQMALIVILCIVLWSATFGYAGLLREKFDQQILTELEEISQQSVALMSSRMEQKFSVLRGMADRLAEEDTLVPEEVALELRRLAGQYSAVRLGVAGMDGTAYNTDGKTLNLSKWNFYRDSIEGKAAISDRFFDGGNGGEVLIFSVPVYHEGEVCGVLYAVHDVMELRKTFEISGFNGKSYSYVVTDLGNVVLDSANEGAFRNLHNIYESIRKASESNREAAAQLKAGIEEGREGNITFYNGQQKYMYYAPLGVHGWYILNVVPRDVMDSTRNYILQITYFLCIAMLAVLAAIVAYIFKSRDQKRKEINEILYTDAVTGGLSYTWFCIEGQRLLAGTQAKAAFIVMDIKRFKLVNELFGYEEGDKTLRYVWSVWKKCSRENEIFCRCISDRFAVLWFYTDRKALEERLEDFRNKLCQGIREKTNATYTLNAVIGVYLVEDNRKNIQQMMNYALIALGVVKGQKGMGYAFYDETFKQSLLQKKLLEDQMNTALAAKEFVAFYQPKYDVDTRELVGAEALVRWIKPDGTMVMPGQFIPLAEENGFIAYLDEYIFAMVCRKQKERMESGRRVVPVSVNLSRKLLADDRLVEKYEEIIQKNGIPKEYVQLEITESAVFSDQGRLRQMVDRLHEAGFRILMDDFGTGYSSLMMLKDVPIDDLKLDKSFLDEYNDAKGIKTIRSVIGLAQDLHIQVTAEGVETLEQYEFLKTLRCDTAQGFYFARPVKETVFDEMLDGDKEITG